MIDSKPTNPPFELDRENPWVYAEGFLSPEECAEVIKLGLDANLQAANIFESGVNKTARNNEISWLNPNENTEWLYQKLSSAISHMNQQFFDFDISGLIEGIQFTKYSAPGDKYIKHVDTIFGGKVRKLSVSVQLSNPQDYDGSELLLYLGEDPEQMPVEQGALVMFPSYTIHEVKPVTRGTRYSLVTWVTGKQFK